MSAQPPAEDAALLAAEEASDDHDVLDRPEAGTRAIRGGAIRGLAYTLTIVLTGATVPLMTRHLGLADFGRFVTASSIVTIVGGVTELGLSGIGTREYATVEAGHRRGLLANLLGLRTTLTLAGLGLAAPLMVAAGYPSVVIGGMLVSGAGLLLLNIQQNYAISLTTDLRWGIASIFELINAAVVAAGTVALVLAGSGLFDFFYVSVVSSAAALLAAAVYLRNRVWLLPRFDRSMWIGLTRDALPYSAAVMVGILYPRVGLIAVSAISSAAQTGDYSTAFKIVEVIGGTSGLIASTAFPVFARAGRDDHERLRYAVGRVADTMLIAGAYITVSLVVAAPFVIEVIGPSSFAGAIPVLRLQALALFAGFIGTTYSYALLSLKMHSSLLRVTIAGLLASVALSALLVPIAGAEGASIAAAASEFMVAAGYLLALSRRHAHLRPGWAVLPKVLAASGVGLLALLIPVPDIARWAITSCAFLMVLAATRAFPPELLHLLPGHEPGSQRV